MTFPFFFCQLCLPLCNALISYPYFLGCKACAIAGTNAVEIVAGTTILPTCS